MMVSSDPIADMLTRIRNAIAVRKSEISLPHSRVKETLAELLKKQGLIDSVEVVDTKPQKTLKLVINEPGTNARILEIDRMSKPGRRLYVGADEIPTVKRGRGTVIISTSKGMMSGDEARAARLGGELICKVY